MLSRPTWILALTFLMVSLDSTSSVMGVAGQRLDKDPAGAGGVQDLQARRAPRSRAGKVAWHGRKRWRYKLAMLNTLLHNFVRWSVDSF